MSRNNELTPEAMKDLSEFLDKHGLVIWGSEYFGVSKPEHAYYDSSVFGVACELSSSDIDKIANKND